MVCLILLPTFSRLKMLHGVVNDRDAAIAAM